MKRFGLLLTASLVCGSMQPAHAVNVGLSSVTARPVRLPATFTEQGIVDQVVINGKRLDFLLDTGADAMYIDAAVAHRLGLQLRKAPDSDNAMTMVDTMSVGPLKFYNLGIKVASIHLETQEKNTVVGLLGSDFWFRGRHAGHRARTCLN